MGNLVRCIACVKWAMDTCAADCSKVGSARKRAAYAMYVTLRGLIRPCDSLDCAPLKVPACNMHCKRCDTPRTRMLGQLGRLQQLRSQICSQICMGWPAYGKPGQSILRCRTRLSRPDPYIGRAQHNQYSTINTPML